MIIYITSPTQLKEQDAQIKELNRINSLYSILSSSGQIDELTRATVDPVFRDELLKKYSI